MESNLLSAMIAAVMIGNLFTAFFIWGVRMLERSERDPSLPFWFPWLLCVLPIVFLILNLTSINGLPESLSAIANMAGD